MAILAKTNNRKLQKMNANKEPRAASQTAKKSAFFLSTLFALVMCFSSGCATYNVRYPGAECLYYEPNDPEFATYPACKLDTYWGFWMGFGLIDLPISFVSDTVMYPFDRAKLRERQGNPSWQ